jgi:nicotinate-nucleotide adenylyltransferase
VTLPRRKIGLFGGFNPAHRGHRAIALAALDRLELDAVWWMVSPQNPLKPVTGMAPFAERLATAQHVANHPDIKVTDIEARLGTRYTADSLRQLRRRFPGYRFVWIMGADNLAQIHRWKDWQEIFNTLPVAVFARPTYSLAALTAPAARRFARARLDSKLVGRLALAKPPAWVFVQGPLDPASASAIRAARSRGAARRP